MLAESVIAAQWRKCPSELFVAKVVAVAQSVHPGKPTLGLALWQAHLLGRENIQTKFHGWHLPPAYIEQEVGVACFSPIFTCQSLSQFAQSFLYYPWRKPASIYNTFINLLQTSATEKFTFSQMELTLNTRL